VNPVRDAVTGGHNVMKKTIRRSRSKGVKKKKSYKKGAKYQAQGSISRTALRFLGIGVCLVLLCSSLSFDIGDWPSGFEYPNNNPTANWCGSIGAFCAYYLLYYVGPGIFIVLLSAIYMWGSKLAGRPVNQLVLRAIGLGLVTVAASTTFYCLWPQTYFNFPTGSGGILGTGVAQLLQSNFASLGTFILLAAIWVVGAVLLADGLMLMVLGGLGFTAAKIMGIAVPAWSAAKEHSQVLNEIWRELSARQKPVVIKNEILQNNRKALQ